METQHQPSKQKQRNSGQCGRGPSWRSQHLPPKKRRDRRIPWEQGRDNGGPELEISTPFIKTETEEFRAVWKGPSWRSQHLLANQRQGEFRGIMAGTWEEQGWRSQRLSYKQKQRNSGQCERIPSWISQYLPSNQRQENSVGSCKEQWSTKIGDLNASYLNRNRGIRGSVEGAPAGDLNASHINRNRGIQGSVEGAPAGDLNTFHLIRDRRIPWEQGRDNGGPALEISTSLI